MQSEGSGTYAVWLEPTLVGESVSIQSLGLASAVEEDVSDTHDQVVNDTTSSDEVDQPAQDEVGSAADLQERKAREDHDDGEADKRYTALGAVAKGFGSTTLDSEAVQTASGAESVGVSGTEDRGNQESADQMRQATNTHVLHGDNVRRGSSSSGSARFTSDDTSQSSISRAEDNTNCHRASHEEQCESEVDSLEGVLDVNARASGFGRDHRDVFRTSDTERCGPESSTEALELTESSSTSPLFEGVVLPVAESVCVVLRVTTDHGDEGE